MTDTSMAQKVDQQEMKEFPQPKSQTIRAPLCLPEAASPQTAPRSARDASSNLGTPRSEASDRASAASQPSVTETDGPGTTSALPQTDYDAKNEILPFKIRDKKLTASEVTWIKENIKTLEQNEKQKASPAPGDQGTCSSQVRYCEQTPTKAFGALFLKEDKKKRENLSLFVRLADNTPGELIEELLVSKFEVTGSECHPIRIHCIDYDRWPSEKQLPQFDTKTPRRAISENDISTRLQNDLHSMCKKTAGIVLTWSGLVKDNPMHHALGGIMKESGGGGRCMQNLVCIATPPWDSVVEPAQKMLQKPKRGNACLQRQPIEKGGCFLGPDISTFATHFLFLDDQTAKPDFSHFHCQMMDALERSEERKTVGMPVVCVLINGHHDALKMVQFALQRRIPVLIVKGSGGYADIIAEVYESAELATTKRTDEYGQVHTRVTKKGTAAAEFYMRDNDSKDPLLSYIFNNLDLLTIYDPAVSDTALDSLVVKALLKNKQESKLHRFVKTMKRIKELCSTKEASIIDSDEEQMEYFIEAVRKNCINVVKTFLDEMEISKKFKQHFHLGRVLKLYRQSAEPKPLKAFRKRYAVLMKKPTVLPLRCRGSVCSICSVKMKNKPDDPEGKELVHQWTCLHPFQELFLSSVLHCYMEMALVFWQRCDDKIAAALVARKMFKSMAEESSDPNIKKQMEKNCRQFQSLAIQTLRNCQNVDETQTELLLTKPCPWWGDISVLQLALMTENRGFINETACRNIMGRIWKGKKYREDRQRYCQLLSDPSKASSSSKRGWFSPFGYFVTNFFMQGVFLLLFSFELLFDLGNGMTYIFIFLIVWVFAITLEEIGQFMNRASAVGRYSNLKVFRTTRTMIQTYFSQDWNWLDVITIILFWLGMVVFVPVPAVHEVGRFLLAIDIFLFYMRTFQMLMVFDDLGLLLVMVFKMMEDTKNFMIILLIFVLAYAVTSESLLYPQSEFTLSRVFYLPRKAYWQVFGEFSLEEIEIREEGSCAVNTSKHLGYNEPQCPTKSGSYIVPVLLGVHVMVTNVLLLNLLIARFGVTFAKVQDEASEYQSWHRCQIITEYCNRTSFPPPFNILSIASCLCCCRRRRTMKLIGMLKAKRSADMRSVDITGINKTHASNSGNESPDSVEIIKIEIMIKLDGQTPSTPGHQRTPSTPGHQQTMPTPETYTVAKKECRKLKQTFTIWDLDPKREYTVKVAGVTVTEEDPGSRVSEMLQEIIAFERNQAENACRQQDSKTLEDVQAQNDALKKEIERLGRELKESQAEASNRFHDRMCKMEKEVKTRLSKMTKKSNIKQGVGKRDRSEEVLTSGKIDYKLTLLDDKLAVLHDQLTRLHEEMDKCVERMMQEIKGGQAT